MFSLQMINEMEKMHREMDQLLCGLNFGTMLEPRVQIPGVQVSNTQDGYRVEASLPGIDVEKLEIDVLGRRLSLSAGMADEETAERSTWHRRERMRNSFKKTLRLPEEIDSERVEAEYKNGILTILLPKVAAALPKRISVKAAQN